MQRPKSEIARLRDEFHGKVAADLKGGNLSYMDLAFKYGISVNTVYWIARKHGCRRSELAAQAERATQEQEAANGR
ncbi:MAG: hypothetical protein ABSG54_18510 [Terriglobia bacterium]|jgi:uncharacterized protein YjcR